VTSTSPATSRMSLCSGNRASSAIGFCHRLPTVTRLEASICPILSPLIRSVVSCGTSPDAKQARGESQFTPHAAVESTRFVRNQT
jgi:hypothetical protein